MTVVTDQLAWDNGKKLLLKSLNKRQKITWKNCGFFDVISQRGNIYRIERGTISNVYLLDDDGHEIKSFCCVNAMPAPIPDIWLAQKMMLEADEDEFLRIAW